MEPYCDQAVPRILVGNKDDAKNEASKVVAAQDGSAYAGENGMLFFEISVKENKNVRELFNTMTKLVLQRRVGEPVGLQQSTGGVRVGSKSSTGDSNSNRKCCTN